MNNMQHERGQIIDNTNKRSYLWRFICERFLDSLVFVPVLFLLLALVVRHFDLYLIAILSNRPPATLAPSTKSPEIGRQPQQ